MVSAAGVALATVDIGDEGDESGNPGVSDAVDCNKVEVEMVVEEAVEEMKIDVDVDVDVGVVEVFVEEECTIAIDLTGE